jgi:spore germination protein KA
MMGVYIHLMTIRSFGVPYMLNVGNIEEGSIKEIAVRYPWWMMKRRPRILGKKNPVRKS